MASIQIGVRVPESIDAELTARGERSTVARATLDAYFRLLREERRSLRRLLTPDEQAAVAAVFNATIIDDVMRFSRIEWPDGRTAPVLVAEVEDPFRLEPVTMEQFDVQPGKLLEKLAGLSAGEVLALLDAVERFWKNDRAGRDPRRLLED